MSLKYEKTRCKLTELVTSTFEADDGVAIIEKEWLALDMSDGDKRSLLDGVLKSLVLEVSDSAERVLRLVDLSVALGRLDVVAAATPIVLLADVLDIATIAQCEQLFSYVEANVQVWKDDALFSACKNSLLRMCNDLLRRLSRSQNTVFRGRILLFLASFFPFSERSGLNLVSEFNSDNLNEYRKEEGEEEAMETSGEETETSLRVDYNLYNKFLTLQDYLRNPTQCYVKLRWHSFALSWSDTFSTFDNMKLERVAFQRRSAREHLDAVGGSPSEGAAVFFAKYLTNPRLLQLQLSDPNFRRSLIIQGLVTLQYLTSSVKSKLDTFELRAVQQDWVKEQQTFLYNLLGETPRGSDRFRDIVRHMLTREQLWNNWKNDSCPELKPPGTLDEAEGEDRPRPNFKRKLLGDVIKSCKNKYYMGNQEMNRLWNLNADNLDACKSPERSFLPSVDEYMAEAVAQMDPALGIEPSYKKVNDANFAWRALRLLSQRSACFFSQSTSLKTINKLPDFLETCLKSLVKPAGANAEEIEIKVEADDDKDTSTTTQTPTPAPRRVDAKLTPEQISGVATRLGDEWLRLGAKLGLTDAADPAEMLQRWAAQDEDATPENLAYTLDGLKFHEAADFLSKGLNKVETVE